MGLDMYLYKATKGIPVEPLLEADNELVERTLDTSEDVEKVIQEIREKYPEVKNAEVFKRQLISSYYYSFFDRIAYWRKANAIHRWFVVNVQNGVDDCDFYLVTKEQLETLLDLCKQVSKQPELAPELLPTQQGFFFGSIDYDEYYLDQIELTIQQIDEVLRTVDFDKYDVYYYSSW